MRSMSTELSDAFEAPLTSPLLLVEFGYDSGAARLHSGLGTIPWNGVNWTGAGTLGGISKLEETTRGRRSSVSYRLAGSQHLDTDQVIQIAEGEDFQDRPVTLWIGARDDNDDVIVDPIVLDQSWIDTIEEDATRGGGSLVVHTYGLDEAMNRSPGLYWDDQTQNARFPGDTGFSRLAPLQDLVIEIEKVD